MDRGKLEAPLLYCNLPEIVRTPNTYVVSLAPGYSMERYKEAVAAYGIDLDPAIEHVLDRISPIRMFYSASLDGLSLQAIRVDPA